jgi:transposase
MPREQKGRFVGREPYHSYLDLGTRADMRFDASADKSRGDRRLPTAGRSKQRRAVAEVHAPPIGDLESTIVLTPRDRARLQRSVRSQVIPVRQHLRSRIVLMAADGLPDADIARRLQIDKRTVRLWRERFVREGFDALRHDAPRSGRPSRLSHDVWDIARRLRDNGWRLHDIARHLAISAATVSRLLARRRDL